MQVRLSVGVQIMVRSDRGSAGVAFTIEPENGNKNLIYVTGAWGLGESVVQGAVNTDEFYVFKKALSAGKNALVYRQLGTKQNMLVYGEGMDNKTTAWKETTPSLRDQYVLTDAEVNTIGRWCLDIEKHYGMPMDIEWAKDGITNQLYIVQARPETVQSQQKKVTIKEYSLDTDIAPILTGKAVGNQIVSGKVRIVKSLADGNKVERWGHHRGRCHESGLECFTKAGDLHRDEQRRPDQPCFNHRKRTRNFCCCWYYQRDRKIDGWTGYHRVMCER